MTTEVRTTNYPSLKLPRRLILFSLAVGLLTPFIARLPSVPVYGWEWFTVYFPGAMGLLFFSAFNLIPSGAWYAIGKRSKKAPLAFWFSVAGGVAFLLQAHGSINLLSSSTAAIGLMFIPIIAVGAILVSWVFGLLINYIIKAERLRFWTVGVVGILAVVYGVRAPVQESRSIVARELRFPFTAVSNIPLQKQHVYGKDFIGRIEVLSYGNFDNTLEKEIAVLSQSSITILKTKTYEVISKTEYNQEDCDGCVHMYPYLVPDGKGAILVSTSDGVSDKNGHLLWQWKASGFSRVVPIQSLSAQPNFLVYQNTDYIALHNTDGKLLWRNNILVSDIGRYNTPEGEQLPFAITGYGESRVLNIYNQEGKLHETIKLPGWAHNVEEVAWPSRGHLLAGAGSWLGVLDPDGNEVLKHIIKETSFNPYHGPNGTAVKFNPTKNPYLAVLSHGSSGYARSVLLIFDPKGKLVWQEELRKLRTIIAVPNEDGSSEVLLVAGMDGVIEYSLSNEAALNKTLQLTPTTVYKLSLSNNQLTSLPESIGNLTNLVQLDLSSNQLTSLPESIGNLTNLQTLILVINQLTILPESIGKLSNLKVLFLGYNQITSLPESIGNLKNLVQLDLENNQLTSLPESIGNLTNLRGLRLNNNQLTSLPESIGNLTKLEELYLVENQLTSLPESIGDLTNLRALWLYDNNLTNAERKKIKKLLPNCEIEFKR